MDFKKLIKKGAKKLGKDKKTKKNTVNFLILILVGILFLICGSFFKDVSTGSKNKVSSNLNKPKTENKDENKGSTNLDYEKKIQEDLKNTLEKIEGVGKVDVMVTFEAGKEKVPAMNITDSTNTSEEKDTEGGTRNTIQENKGNTVVVTNNGDKTEPLIVKEYKPRIIGVCIVAEGAEKSVTKLRISDAVINLFNIPENKVNVYPMKK